MWAEGLANDGCEALHRIVFGDVGSRIGNLGANGTLMNQTPQLSASPPKLLMERTYEAFLDEVWALWTTKAGIESWWGPEGFSVVVRSLDLRIGGELRYVMTATGASQIAFMNRAGMPLATEAKITFTDFVPLRRLAYLTLADFVPGVAAYSVATQVELSPVPGGVRMILAFDRMHDDIWTERAFAGWESELRKLAAFLAVRDREGRDAGPSIAPLDRRVLPRWPRASPSQFVLYVATDAVLHLIYCSRLRDSECQMGTSSLLPNSAAFTVAGGYVTARLAPD